MTFFEDAWKVDRIIGDANNDLKTTHLVVYFLNYFRCIVENPELAFLKNCYRNIDGANKDLKDDPYYGVLYVPF
jgi:hypothetical protein